MRKASFITALLCVASAIFLSVVSAADCSKPQQTIVHGPVQLGFTTILDHGNGTNGYLNVEVVYEGNGWVGWGYSQSGKMITGYAVVGIPNKLPSRYSLKAMAVSGVNELPESQQTLKTSSMVAFNGTHTIMSFAKRLDEEDGEFTIDGRGLNRFLLAWGSGDSISYHYERRHQFNMTLEPCVQSLVLVSRAPVTATPSTQPPVPLPSAPIPATASPGGFNQIVGDCSQIQQLVVPVPQVRLGFTSTLDNGVGPNGWIQVEMVYEGQGWISWGYSQNGNMIPGYAVVGVPGYLPTRFHLGGKTKEEILPLNSDLQTLNSSSVVFQNTTHTIMSFSKRLIENPDFNVNGTGQNAFLVAWGQSNVWGYHGSSNRASFYFDLKACIPPSSDLPPTAAPPTTLAPANQIVGDCMKIQQLVNPHPLIHLGFTTNLDNGVGPNGYLRVDVTYNGIGWIAWGYSESGNMTPGYSVVGVPGYRPTRFHMVGQKVEDQRPVKSQSLVNNEFVFQNETHTMMSFTKRLIENPDFNVDGVGPNAFLVAWGQSNEWEYHGPGNRLSFKINLKACVEAPTPPAAAPVPPPAETPTIYDPIMGDCSVTQQIADFDIVRVGMTATLDNNVGPNGYILVQVTYVGVGWVAWGHSQSGNMAPGYAVLGISGYSPTEFYMASKTPDGIQGLDGSHQTLTGASLIQNSTHTILTFKKRLIEDQKDDINGNGLNNFLLAWGNDNNFRYHGKNRIAYGVYLRPCVDRDSASSPETVATFGSSSTEQHLLSAHGFLAAVAWGILAPTAIGASLLRRMFIASDLPGLWFKLHMSINMAVFVFTALAFSFAVRAISLLPGSQHFGDVQHRTTGLILMMIVFVQTLSGIFRPHVPLQRKSVDDRQMEEIQLEEPRQPAVSQNTTRSQWEIGHRLVGFTVLALAWWQVQTGLNLYAQYYEAKNRTGAFWGITSSVVAIILAFYVFQYKYC